MNRLIAILLVLILMLCGCDAGTGTPTEPNTPGHSGGEQTTDPTSGQSAEPTRPADVELVDYNTPALKVKISFDPELELTLSRTNEILEVKALNAQAEGLVADLDLVGKLYESGIVTILEEAKEQKYLKNVSKVTIAVEELSDGAWTIATEECLTKPIEDYQQDSGIIFSCRIKPAGESLNIDELKAIDTSRSGEVSVTVYGDAAGNAKMMVYESDDGTRQEGYLISDTEEIWNSYYPDGSYQYSHYKGLVYQGYWICPDGTGFTYSEYMELADGLMQPVWYQEIYFDGSAKEYFYEDSEFVRTIFTDADGSVREAFYENGTIVSEVWKDADGNILDEFGGRQPGNPTSGQYPEPTRPAGAEPIEVDGAALCVTVTMNAKFELYLDLFNEILDGKAQNEAAQNLLADLQIVGKPYSEGITLILSEAQQQGFLQNRAKLSIGTKELVEGGWNHRSEATLLDPIEAYKSSSGLALSCEFYPAEKPLDEITYVHTNKRDGYREEICYDVTDRHILTRRYFDDGSYWETDWVHKTSYYWNADGSYAYEDWADGFSNSYTIHPDGTVDREMRTVDDLGNRTDWELFLYADGSSWENFYDKRGNLTKSISTYADGSSSESFYENAEMVRSFHEYPDGSSVEYFYENGVSVCAVKRNTDGTSSEEQYYYKNGELVRLLATFSDGTTRETFYENGQPVRMVYTSPDGSTWEESGGNGDSAGTNPDGSTFEQTLYPSGSQKTYDITWPNGDYQKQTYYENGNLETHIEFRDGRYVESRYDENGMLTASSQRNPDGAEYSCEYRNGILVKQTETYPNGDYQYLTFYENGQTASIVAVTDGSYWENHYDENGNLTKMIREDEDGNKVEEPIS